MVVSDDIEFVTLGTRDNVEVDRALRIDVSRKPEHVKWDVPCNGSFVVLAGKADGPLRRIKMQPEYLRCLKGDEVNFEIAWKSLRFADA